MPLVRKHTWTPRTVLGHMNEELIQILDRLNLAESIYIFHVDVVPSAGTANNAHAAEYTYREFSSAAATTTVRFAMPVPEHWRLIGGTVVPFALFAGSTGSATNVRLDYNTAVRAAGDALTTTTLNEQVTVAMPAIADSLVYDQRASALTIGSTSRLLHGNFSRLGADAADTYGGLLRLVALGFVLTKT